MSNASILAKLIEKTEEEDVTVDTDTCSKCGQALPGQSEDNDEL